MRTFEIFDKIINGELRPNNYESDGKKLEEKISKLNISEKEYFDYLKYLDKQGKPYTFTVKEQNTDKVVINEERNAEYEQLIDLDIPPEPDKKGEEYLSLIEFEFVRNVLIFNEIIEGSTKEQIEEFGIKSIIKLKKLWEEREHLEKLLFGGKPLEYTGSNDFVLIILKVYLERIANELIDRFKPFVKENLIEEFYNFLNAKRNRMLKEIDETIRRIERNKKLNLDKQFDKIFEELTKAKTIEEKLYNEMEFWKNHRYEKIEGFSQEERDFISKSMVEDFESELNKARVTGWIRGNKIELEKAERLHKYMKEILSEYDLGKKNNSDKRNLELNDFAKVIDDEIKSVNAMGSISEERNMEDFKSLWEELIEGNFDLKILLRQFEQIGEDREDEYIEYCVRRFRHRTKDEWIRFYATKNLTENIEALKKARLPEELEYKNTIRITNAKFEESTLGQWTRENLESFESKYVTKDYLQTLTNKIKKLRTDIDTLIKKRLPIKSEMKKLSDTINDLEMKYDNDIDEFPHNLADELVDCKNKLEKNEQALNNIDIQLWGTFDSKEEGLIWKHDDLVRDFKLHSIGDKELFKELDYKSTDRWTEKLKMKISQILLENRKKIGEDEMDELVLEVLKQHQSDDEEVYEEILDPTKSEKNLIAAINKVLSEKKFIKETKEDGIEIPEIIEQTIESQRNKIKKYLKENYPDFISNPIDNISEIAAEIVLKIYPELNGSKKKNKVKSIRVELTNIRSGRIPFVD